MIHLFEKNTAKVTYLVVILLVMGGACAEFFDVAQGTGDWWQGFAFTWFLFFVLFCIASLLGAVGVSGVIFNPIIREKVVGKLLHVRARFARFGWAIVGFMALLPVLLFQAAPLGVIFQGTFIRGLLWGLVVLGAAAWVSTPPYVIEYKNLLAGIVLTGALYAVAASFQTVSDYPFSLTWSEGNRIWDYSILFGRGRYIYPPDQNIRVLLDPGRQWIGGLPFLIPQWTIGMQRFWLGLMEIVPYAALGAVLFRFERKAALKYAAAALWVYLFLAQGPIHAPLVFSAALIAAAWRRPLWVAVPLVAAGGFLAGISRYTWMFAPAMWIGMLELSSMGSLRDRQAWARLMGLVLPALAAGVILPELISLPQSGAWSLQSFVAGADLAPSTIQARVTQQPLLWYRLFPNATFGAGILLGLAWAAGPLIILLMYLQFRRIWQPAWFHNLAYGGVLLAFLAVGLVVSVKIGGGGDLHNLDMFLLGLVFVAAIAWRQGGGDWLTRRPPVSLPIRLLVVTLAVIPAFAALMSLRSYGYYTLSPWLAALTGESPQKLGLIPPKTVSDAALETLRAYVHSAQSEGEVLFMDQRQLLTFGYIQGLPLVPEYDKKVLIERAFTQNRAYFERFYTDLSNHRFSLIVTQPQTVEIKDGEYHFAEENNYWVEWVSRPLLCYYTIVRTLPEVNVQLLTPRADAVDCQESLP